MNEKEKAKFMAKAVEEILEREAKDLSYAERLMVTVFAIQLMELLSGVPLNIKLRIIRIISDYLHTAEGLLKE